jgi:hypothetical protein
MWQNPGLKVAFPVESAGMQGSSVAGLLTCVAVCAVCLRSNTMCQQSRLQTCRAHSCAWLQLRLGCFSNRLFATCCRNCPASVGDPNSSAVLVAGTHACVGGSGFTGRRTGRLTIHIHGDMHISLGACKRAVCG